ncbi:MAG TPA: DUF2249 domain-containing protein [Devosia sp.]|jgi:uncharacterized protein (DUF2249 family)|uniref:DUF2249 domain-containing protein n=1 Tax=Devosia sp. TaxID=1871048 RepID=UPI002DDD11D4|nr:DUF2249 domain-containing protein [Devosia sp.]HEV2515841.1 DUF2249 domain-containing protein [Devosia sp.]
MCNDCQTPETIIDVRTIAPRMRHPLIFTTFETLGGGDSLLLVNDHDPRPLFYLFNAEYPGIFEWTYEKEGPEIWQVRISRLVA